MDHAADARLAACERQIRHLRRALGFTVGLLATAGTLVLTGFMGRDRVPAAAQPSVQDTLRVRHLIIVDGRGVVRARLAGDLPDPTFRGRSQSRGDQAAGLLVFDSTGKERGGYVTFARSGAVALTLDGYRQQSALFVADTDGATALRMWRGRSWAEMKVDQTGAHVTAGRDGAVAFMQPAMTDAEGQRLCAELKAELSQAQPPVPPSDALAACKAHAADRVCRKCLGIP